MTVAVDGADFATWSVSMAQGLSQVIVYEAGPNSLLK